MKPSNPRFQSLTSVSALLMSPLLTAALLLVSSGQTTQAGPSILPLDASPYGMSTAEWFKSIYEQRNGSPLPDHLAKHILYLPPLQPGTPSGSGTVADPLVFEGAGSVTTKPG